MADKIQYAVYTSHGVVPEKVFDTRAEADDYADLREDETGREFAVVTLPDLLVGS